MRKHQKHKKGSRFNWWTDKAALGLFGGFGLTYLGLIPLEAHPFHWLFTAVGGGRWLRDRAVPGCRASLGSAFCPAWFQKVNFKAPRGEAGKEGEPLNVMKEFRRGGFKG